MTRILVGVKILVLSILVTGCASTNNGKLYMEFKSEKNKMKISHDKIYIERIIARW